MPSLNEIIDEKVSKISEKVKSKQGEIVLCFREFSIPSQNTGCFPAPSHDFSHYEAGIINGEVQQLPEMKTEFIDLDKGLWVMKAHNSISSYLAMGNHVIPVDRKLDSYLPFFNDFQFDMEKLEHLQQGQILIDNRGLAESIDELSAYFGTLRHAGYNRRFNLLIGDEEVNNFLTVERRIGNSHELFSVLKDKIHTDAKIKEHYYEKRKSLGKSLVVTTNIIANAVQEIREMEDNLMNAKFVWISDYDNGYRNWDDSHNAQVCRYEKLKIQISEKRKDLISQLGEGEKLYEKGKIVEPLISGYVVGYPSTLTFDYYSHWIKSNFVPQVEQTFAKIDSYLKEQREKAK